MTNLSLAGTARSKVLSFVLLSLLAYLLGQDGVPVEDGAELLTVARLGGTNHPPGMPLLSLICRVSWVALGQQGLRVVFALMAASALWVLSKERGMPGLLLSIGILALPETRERLLLWDAYGPVFLLFAVTLKARFGSPLLLGLLTGLGLAVHPICIFLPVIYLGRKDISVALLSGIALGLTPYLALPLYSAAGAVVDWGSPSHVSAFLRQISASAYRDAYGSRMGSLVIVPLLAHLRSLGRMLWPATLLPVIIGAAAIYRRYSGSLALRLGGLLALEAVFVWQVNPMASGTSQTGVLALFVFSAIAFCSLDLLTPAVALPVAAALIVAGLLGRNPLRNQRGPVEESLRVAPPNACFYLADNDMLYGCWQLKYVEDRRPDVALLSTENFSGWFEDMVNHFNPAVDLSSGVHDVGGPDQPRQQAAARLIELTIRMNPGRPFLTDEGIGK